MMILLREMEYGMVVDDARVRIVVIAVDEELWNAAWCVVRESGTLVLFFPQVTWELGLV